MILIGIAGKRGTGKDLLASFFKQKYGFINIPFAQELKESVRRDFNLTKEHTDGGLKEHVTNYKPFSPRDIMIAYGQFFRQFDKLWWVKKTFQKIGLIDSMHPSPQDVRVTISDVRFKNEADYIKEQGGILIRLERKPELNIYKGISTDVSECDLDDYEGFDFRMSANENINPQDLSDLSYTVMETVLSEINAD